MSHPLSQHRKSQSTSALSVLATQPSSSAPRRERRSQHPSSTLSGLAEVAEEIAGTPASPALSRPGRTGALKDEVDDNMGGRGRGGVRDSDRGRCGSWPRGEDEVKVWIGDILSIRSPAKRRLAALRGMEKALVRACGRGSSEVGCGLGEFIGLQLHTPLISLLTRHAQALAQRASANHTSLPAGDELANDLVPEIECILDILQGLCLLSRACKTALGQSWVLEILIDLLLVLRAQAFPASSSPRNSSSAPPKYIAYTILELLCCALVDAPLTVRAFERLSGLEAVMRVLKGPGVIKEVRMKCLEFLYFYLLPEQSAPQRATSSSSTSSSSSAGSRLYPPTPFTMSEGSLGSQIPVHAGRTSPSSQIPPSPKIQVHAAWEDLDIPFTPQTPRKQPQPVLGYLTPSANRRTSSSSRSATPSLPTVPGSPIDMVKSPSSRRLGSSNDFNDLTPVPTRTTREKRSSQQWSRQSQEVASDVGLGLGLPKSPSTPTGFAHSETARGITAFKVPIVPSMSDPFAPDSRLSSGSSTVLTSPRSLPRSETQPTMTVIQSSSRHASNRRSSVRRVSRSPLVQSTLPDQPESPEVSKAEITPRPPKADLTPRPAKIRQSRTQSHLSGFLSPAAHIDTPPLSSPSRPPGLARSTAIPPSPHEPKVCHSRTHSHLSGLPIQPASLVDLPASPASLAPPPTPSSLSRSPSTKFQPKRAFPAEHTRGLPSSSSSPNFASPLGAARRVPSDKRSIPPSPSTSRLDSRRTDGKDRPIKTVQEKKELLGNWLGNVEALVAGVEKVSFWGAVGQVERG